MRAGLVNIGDGDQPYIKTLLGLFQLAFCGPLLSFCGLQVIKGTQYIEVGLGDTNNKILLIKSQLRLCLLG